MFKYILVLLLIATPCLADGLIVTPSAIGVAPIGSIPGIANNSTACVGCVGEPLTANRESGTAWALTSNTAKSIVTVTLTPGTWEISGNVCFDTGTGTTLSLLLGAVTTSQDSITGISTFNQARLSYNAIAPGNGATTCFTTPRQLVYISTNTPYYLNGYATFGTSTLTGYGSLLANRIR